MRCPVLLLALWSLLAAMPARAEPVGRFSQDPISAEALESSIKHGLDKVEEVTFLRNEMKKLGLTRGWLFGGTAAAFGHYANWDARQKLGDQRFQPNRFDYDYTNIFRSNQDLDIVIDGTPEQAEKLEARLREVYPHLQGTQSAWEVRLLRTSRGSKEALVNNPNFLNQHTDSNSTGLIEITDPPAGDNLVRDLRDEGKRYPKFFEDVRRGKLKFYFSDLHHTTNRFIEGKNPPIFSVIRYLTKAFQYELETDPADAALIRQIIQDFKPESLNNPEAIAWLTKNGKKLFQNAVNLEYAANTLDQYGLRDKLKNFDNPHEIGSLAWLMNRKPLPAFPLGEGKGKTAQELGIAGMVSHETSDYLAYESITRSHTGEPNVFTSREVTAGEAAVHGEGFYTKVGSRGGRDNGITIRFELHPDARENIDFTYVKKYRYVVVHNKNALKVIPESLDLTPLQFFRILAKNGDAWGPHNKIILEKFKRRMSNKLQAHPEELAEISRFVTKALLQKKPNEALLTEWFSLLESRRHAPEWVEKHLRPLTKAKNPAVHWRANFFLRDLNFPSALDGQPPVRVYFQALQEMRQHFFPKDPYLLKFQASLAPADLLSASAEEMEKIFSITEPILKIGPASSVDDGLYAQSQWHQLWRNASKDDPQGLRALAKKLVTRKDIIDTSRSLAMDTLVQAQRQPVPDPSFVDFCVQELRSDSIKIRNQAIRALIEFLPEDPRLFSLLLPFLHEKDPATSSLIWNAFEKIKFTNPATLRALVKKVVGGQQQGLTLLTQQPPSDPVSEKWLKDSIRSRSPDYERAVDVLYKMPNSSPERLAFIADLLSDKKYPQYADRAAELLLADREYKQKSLAYIFDLFMAEEKYSSQLLPWAKTLVENEMRVPEVRAKLQSHLNQKIGRDFKVGIRGILASIDKNHPAPVALVDCPEQFHRMQR